MKSLILTPELTTLVFAALVSKLGGRAEITQDDIDGVAYHLLEEEMREDGVLELRLVAKSSHQN